jgi:hypothetical protein
VAIIHAQRADEQGNVQIFGTSASDLDMAMAAKSVIVTVEEIVSSEQIRTDKTATVLFRTEVDMVIHAPFGAIPCSCVPYYTAHLMQMMKDSQGISDPKTAGDYIRNIIGKNEEEYLNNIGGDTAKKKLKSLVKKNKSI